MKIFIPAFGFLSAMATSSVFLPHALVVLGVIFLYPEHSRNPVPPLLFFTITARLIGDWMFWAKFFPEQMNSGENNETWRSSLKDILTSHPFAIKSISSIVIDAAIDVTLICLAFKTSASPVWILFIFSACQGVGALIQGTILLFFERKTVRILSAIITLSAVLLAFEITDIISVGHIKLFGLSYFSKSIQICIVLASKCLFTGTTVTAKATIAETIKIETMNEIPT